MSNNLHAEGPGAFRDFEPNLPQCDNSESLAAKFRALQRLLFPLASMHEFVGARDETSHAQHEPDCDFGDGDRVRPWRVHHCDPLTGCRLQLDVVHANASAADYT